jgi:hypothetical protein
MTDRDERAGRSAEDGAATDGSDISAQAPRLLEEAIGVEWYERPGSDVDRAAYALCRLRRAGGVSAGDEAVRQALAQASPAALVWFVSRTISFMDESGFPEAVELWFHGDDERE